MSTRPGSIFRVTEASAAGSAAAPELEPLPLDGKRLLVPLPPEPLPAFGVKPKKGEEDDELGEEGQSK
jgi:hypothetical protein